MAKTQTRQEHYDECVANKLPLFEIITPGTIVGKDAAGRDMVAIPSDVNSTDVRDIDDKGVAGPWRRAEG